ncbi:protein ENTREP3 [Latimeria chalumnae]|uniref:protein ENTREP3 n=1 Tax=Latimeria chalumnae TaxID=7897 RepID=UPI00313E1854
MPSLSDSTHSFSQGTSQSLYRLMLQRARMQFLLALGILQVALGSIIVAVSFAAVVITASSKVRHSCPFWAGFSVLLSGLIGVVSWKRPLTLVVTFFMLISAVSVMLCLAGSILSSQNSQLVKTLSNCKMVWRMLSRSHILGSCNNHIEKQMMCTCCQSLSERSTESWCNNPIESLTLHPYWDCKDVWIALKDLLFSVYGLTIVSTIICSLSTIISCIQIFSIDVMHILIPQQPQSVNPECATPQDGFQNSLMDFDEFVPPVPPPPYYPPEYTCSSETDAQSITYNGSMESPVPLYPMDFPPPYEAVVGQRTDSQATVFEAPATEASQSSFRGRMNSTVFSGEVSMDSGSLLMSEIVDIPDDSSPSEDSCLLEVQGSMRSMDYVLFRSMQRSRADYCLSVDCVQCGSQVQSPKLDIHRSTEQRPGPRVRGERSSSCSSPSSCFGGQRALQETAARSCNRLEGAGQPEEGRIPEIRVRASTPRWRASCSEAVSTSAGSVHQRTSSQGSSECSYVQRRYSENSRPLTPVRGLAPHPLMRSHSDPGLSTSNEAGWFVCLFVCFFSPGDLSSSRCSKAAADEVSQSSNETAPSSEACLLSLPCKDTPKPLGQKAARKNKPQVKSSPLQRLSKEATRSLGDLKVCRGTRVLVARFLQRSKRNLVTGPENAGSSSQGHKRRVDTLNPFEQILRSPRHTRRSQRQEGIHLQSCGDLSSTSSLRRLLSSGGMEQSRPHSLIGVYRESAL